jgi:hypothetical protein
MFLPRVALLSPFSSRHIRNTSLLRVLASPSVNGNDYLSWELIDLPDILGSQVEWAAHGRDASNGTVFKGAGDGKFALCSRELPLGFRRVADEVSTSPFRGSSASPPNPNVRG